VYECVQVIVLVLCVHDVQHNIKKVNIHMTSDPKKTNSELRFLKIVLKIIFVCVCVCVVS